MKKYYNPVKVLFGTGSINHISSCVKECSSSNHILIVSGKKSMREQGIIQNITDDLLTNDFKVKTYEKVESNPTIEFIDKSIEFVRKSNFDAIIGLGGGSALDTAKIMAILGNTQGSIRDFLVGKKKIIETGIPLIEIPTTSGTGSEVTMWATVWEMTAKMKKKYSLSHKKMYARTAIIDPSLTLGVSPRQTAISGLDALSQAIEAYWSKNRNPTSDIHALNAIDLIFNNILLCYKDPKNISLREKLALGSLESGLAFSNTKTTAVHSVSYPITSYFGVPHGLACALTLGSFMEYNSIICNDNTKDTFVRILKIAKILQSDSVFEAKNTLRNLMMSMELPTRLSELNIFESDIELIVDEAFSKGRIDNNPRKVTKENLKSLLITLI